MRSCLLLLSCALLTLNVVPAQATEWTVTGARATFSLSPSHLDGLGLAVVPTGRSVQAQPGHELGLEPPLYAFAAGPADLRVTTEEALPRSVTGDALDFAGGLLVQVRDPRTGAPHAPLSLLDFRVSIDPELGRDPVVITSTDPSLPHPLEIRSATFGVDLAGQRLWLRAGDVKMSAAWANGIGRPEWAGTYLGGFDLQLDLRPLGPITDEVRAPELERSAMTTKDVLLGELYDLVAQGHIGTYPNGVAGLAAATTSCNNGDTDIPWNAPMATAHPFIGLALFREMNGTLEQIGKNWVKHGWFAFANDQCFLGCVGGGGSYLAVGCSDTYSATNNGERYVLGPRQEVTPYADSGMWDACGSFFDDVPVDCERDFFGGGVDPVERRIEVNDSDLALPGATYKYEGCYYVAGDDTLSNNVGWRESTMSWTGTAWDFDDVNPLQLAPNPGPVVASWGDYTDSVWVAPDDGPAFLSVKVTDLGGGQWHYDYALYNRASGRGIRSFTVPVGTATITNVDFRDIDDKATNEWAHAIADGAITWSTDDFVTDPNANYIEYQSMYNFRFDADQGPVSAPSRGLLFLPGTGDEFYLDTLAPSASTDAPVVAAASALSLDAPEPNPFSVGTQVRFTLPEAASARLAVVDVTGRVVRVLLDAPVPAGPGVARWDGLDASGTPVASGVYFFRLTAGTETRTVKTTLLR